MSTGIHTTAEAAGTPHRVGGLLSFLTLSGLARGGVRDLGLFILRLGTLPLMLHGIHKAMGYSGFVASLGENPVGAIAPGLFGFLVVAGQILLGVFLTLGLFTRWCGLLLTILFAFIILAVNLPSNGLMSAYGGLSFESSLYYAVPGIVLFLTGPGRLSIDHALTKREAFI